MQTKCFPGFFFPVDPMISFSSRAHVFKVCDPISFVLTPPYVYVLMFTFCSPGIQTIDSTQALFLPIGASVSLLVMFFFFDSVQVVFTICTAGNYCYS